MVSPPGPTPIGFRPHPHLKAVWGHLVVVHTGIGDLGARAIVTAELKEDAVCVGAALMAKQHYDSINYPGAEPRGIQWYILFL